MRPYVFFAVLVAAGFEGYLIWFVFGDSWLLSSIGGVFWGWIGCVGAFRLAAPPLRFNVVSPRHPARFPKVR